jgi:hypothetical protein
MGAKYLEKLRVQNPLKRDSGKWYAAEIEMAMFACLRKL